MIEIFIFICVLGAVVTLGTIISIKADERAKLAQKQATQAENDRIHAGIDLCKAFMEEHISVLARKYFSLVVKNEYGVYEFDSWNSEFRRYVERVLAPKIFSHGVLIQPDELYEFADAAFEELHAAFLVDSDNHFIEFSEDMTGVEYESLVASILTENGWDVATTKATGDQGVDLIAERFDQRVAIQCKRYSQRVGNSAVQEAATGMQHYGCTEAWVVSNADYTPSARQLASTTGVRLLHHTELAAL